MRKIISLALLLLILPVVLSLDISTKGCTDQIKIGINSQNPSAVFSPDCSRESPRLLYCDCVDTVRLFSKDKEMKYNFIVNYNEGDVPRTKSFYDVQLVKTYVDLENIDVLVYFFVGLIIAPILIIIVVMYIGRRVFIEPKEDAKNGKSE